MYLEYWGFQKFPFENVPDPSIFYLSGSHEEALTRLIYAAEMRKGGAMLSGEIGCGKTTLTRVYVEELSRDDFDMGLIINPRLNPEEFLQEVLYQFDIKDAPESKVKCLRLLNGKMMENMEAKRETLLIVDEAQLLSDETFEEIRLLLNFQLNERFLLTIILVGQPELMNRVKGIEQLDQRIPIKYHLRPFDFADSLRYIEYRQEKAGREQSAFDRSAAERIFEHTHGVPRKINNLCDLALLIGLSKNAETIDAEIIESVINDGTLL